MGLRHELCPLKAMTACCGRASGGWQACAPPPFVHAGPKLAARLLGSGQASAVRAAHVRNGEGLHVCGGVGQQEHDQAARHFARVQRRRCQVCLHLRVERRLVHPGRRSRRPRGMHPLDRATGSLVAHTAHIWFGAPKRRTRRNTTLDTAW